MSSLKKIQYRLLASFSSLLAITNAFAAQPYLDDANKSYLPAGSAPSISQHEYPRIVMHENHFNLSGEALSKYMLLSAPGVIYDRLNAVQSFSPDTLLLRHVSGRAYQSFTAKPCYISLGPAFEGTGPVSQGGPSTAGCNIYAGHWLYRAGSKLTQAINATTLTLNVADASRFDVGRYIVIYNAPAGSFNNPEHARIKSRNLQNKTITLYSRGFKSNASSHANGSIVAQHVQGQGPEEELWAFNFSSKSPRDGNNRTFMEFYSEWLKNNINRYKNGQTTSAKVAGLMFDADFYFDLKSKNSDHNNDLIVDHGISAGGVNWLGDGLDTFYSLVRQKLPNKYILSGVHDARGYDSIHGTEMENWLDYGNGDFRGDPQYLILNSMFAHYIYSMSESTWGAPLGHNTTKTATRLYPGIASPTPTSNAPVRLALAMTLMDNGFFGTHSRYTADAWWDEYAVDVTPGSINYGNAINKNNVNGVHQHRGWLGKPLGPFKRIYKDLDFAPTKSILTNSTFDSNINSWTGANVSISRVTTGQFEGNGALRSSAMNNYNKNQNSSSIQSEVINIVKDQQYTLAFSARSSREREILVALGWTNKAQRIPIGTSWRRYVVSFVAKKTENVKLLFNVGREDSVVWLDSVYMFKGNANVFRRDFENGIVVANATPVSRTVNLGASFQRISGTQDPAINNGQVVTSVTLPPYDGLLLVRPDGGSAPPPPPPPAPGTASIGDFVWDDANSNGIQDGNESGRAAVTVQLQNCTGSTLDSTVTDANGAYGFSGLASGNYRIKFIAPQGSSFSPTGQGSNAGFDSNADPITGLTNCYTLADNQFRPGIDAGILPPQAPAPGTASIGDFVWNDANSNGIQDGNESGRAAVTVQLQNCAGSTLDSTVTDANGAYAFTGLASGNYRIKFIAPQGDSFSPIEQGGSIEFDSNADPTTGLSSCYTLSDNQSRFWVDAGILPPPPPPPSPTGPATIGDYVWHDANGNGLQDRSESGLAGVTVQLLNCQGNILDATVTDTNGAYGFTDLAIGNYQVQFIAPSGASFSPAGMGSSIESDSNPDPVTGLSPCYSMSEVQTRVWIDAGIILAAPPPTGKASIGNHVWEDSNSNGIQDANESGLTGITVQLRTCEGAILDTTLTNKSGDYIFANLAAGDYRIKFIAPPGGSFSPTGKGSNIGLDSNANPVTGLSICYSMTANLARYGVDAGIIFSNINQNVNTTKK